ncbi:MAG: GNAT family protein [Bacteroidales bacterium]|nr:GNAT family N-acetyltransferase [Bacteroidales bacterium]MBS3774031.1 GNAT family N-acetyltransferase [Bacteroidales bacterium]
MTVDILEERDIKLRAIEPSDADLIYRWENDSSVWHAGNTIEPFSRHIINQYVQTAHLDLFQTKQLRLMIDLKSGMGESAETIGSVDLFEIDSYHQKAGIGILIHKEKNRNKGYAGQALDVMIKYAFGVLLLHQLYCNIDEDNEPSLNLFRKKGFQVTGNKKDWIRTKNGWKNELFLQLINPEH